MKDLAHRYLVGERLNSNNFSCHQRSKVKHKWAKSTFVSPLGGVNAFGIILPATGYRKGCRDWRSSRQKPDALFTTRGSARITNDINMS